MKDDFAVWANGFSDDNDFFLTRDLKGLIKELCNYALDHLDDPEWKDIDGETPFPYFIVKGAGAEHRILTQWSDWESLASIPELQGVEPTHSHATGWGYNVADR